MTRPHSWHPWGHGGDDRCILCGEMRSRASALCGAPGGAPTPTPEIATLLEQREQEIRRTERERAAALLRAYADTRPAGEAYALVRLAHTIETGTRHTLPATEPTCAKCGHPRSDHPYRHPFQSRARDA